MPKRNVYIENTVLGGMLFIKEAEGKYYPNSKSWVRQGEFQCLICGEHIIKAITEVKDGNQRNCKKCAYKGSKNPNFKHEGTYKHKSAEYKVYYGMIARCYNEKSSSYYNYGGRGIKICDRWLGKEGFENFVKDVGERPSMQHSIDRINVNKNYEPSNCRWATPKEQNEKKRNGINQSLLLLEDVLCDYPSDVQTIADYINWMKQQLKIFRIIKKE